MDTARKSVSLAATAAILALGFAGVSAPAIAKEKAAKTVHCYGVNSCKGTSECKSYNHDCKGQNECKAQGYISLSKKKCAAMGGKLTES